MREKYVEERFPEWFVFGHLVGHPELVFISDGYRDDLGPVPADAAEQICDRHNMYVKALFRLADSYDKADEEAFIDSWYNKDFQLE